MGGAQIFGDLFRLHHRGAALRERRLLAGFRRELAELFHGMTQPIRFAVGALDFGAVVFDRNLAGTALFPKPGDFRRVAANAAVGIEQRAMSCGIDKGAVVVLAVDLDKSRTERAQHLHADGLVVDKGAGAAIGKLHPAHDQLTVTAEIVIGQHPERRMAFGEIERGNDLALLGAFAHQRSFAASAERQREGIEQDRFAGAGLACKRGKAGTEIDVEAVDQDDVTNGKSGQHRRPGGSGQNRMIFAILRSVPPSASELSP